MTLTRCSCIWRHDPAPAEGDPPIVVAVRDPNCPGHLRDPRPQPGDGPEYHADLAYWLQRHPEERK